MTRWITAVLLVLVPGVALGQTPVRVVGQRGMTATTVSTSLTTDGDAVCFNVDSSVPSVVLTLTGTWTGTVSPRARNASGTLVTPPSADVSATSTTSNAAIKITNSGYTAVCLSATAAMTGTAVVTAVAGAAGASGSGSSGGDVNLAEIGGGAVTTTVPGALDVNIVGGAGSGGTAIADDGDFTAGTTQFTPAGGFYQSGTPTACTDGDTCAFSITLGRALKVALANEDGTLAGGVSVVGTLAANGAAAATNRAATLPAIVETGSLPTLTDGRDSALYVNTNGALYVAPTSGSFSTDCTHDSAACSTGPQEMKVAAAFGTLPSAVTAADAVRSSADLQGVTYIRSSADACNGGTLVTLPISVAADTAVISASASNRTYICGGALVAAAAEVVNIWEGTGTACGTSSAALVGSTTEANGMSLAANGGFSVPSTIRGLSTNVDVCIRLNGTNRVAGWLVYVQAP